MTNRERLEELAEVLTEVETLREDAGVISVGASQHSFTDIHMPEDDFLAAFDPSEFVLRLFGHVEYPYEAVAWMNGVRIYALPVRSTANRLIESGVRVES